MPRFTITQDGKPVSQVDAHGDRIDLGSARNAQVQIDDLLISLKQAMFVRTTATELYRVEPTSRIPAFTLNGEVVEQPAEVPDGAVLAVEGYRIRIDYLPGEIATQAPPATARPAPPLTPQPPLPPPLEPDLPPPLEASQPGTPSAATSPGMTAPSTGPADMERTVFVRRIGKLTATAGPLKGQQWDLKSGETRIGRESGQNDIVIRFDAQGNIDNSISRRHASVHVTGDRVYVEDVGSAAGTFVNGNAVPAQQRVEVRAQDLIEIRSSRESTLLRVEIASAKVAPVMAPAQSQPAVAPNVPPAARPAEPVATSAPRHESPGLGDLGAEEPPVVRRRRRDRETNAADNVFVPLESPRGSGRIPRWGWIVAGAGILLLIIVILLIAP